MAYWLVKSEPFVYNYDQLETDKSTSWTGVRNYAARLHLRAMKKDDLVLFYHSNEGLAIVGIAKIIKEAYPDPTAAGQDWSTVDIAPHKKINASVTLEQIKKEPALAQMALVRIGRLSVQPVTAEEWKLIMKMAGEK